MRYGQIRKYDIANGPGIRTSIFVTGCTHACPGCFNLEYQNFKAGDVWTDAQTNQVIEYLQDDVVEGLTLLGGEPFQNAKELLEVVRTIKKHSNKSIWVYSGYTWDELMMMPIAITLLKECDVLIDGRFVQELLDLKLKFRGSSNQRIIDIQASFAKGEPVICME